MVTNGIAHASETLAERPMKNGSIPREIVDTISNSDYIDTKTPYISRIIEQKSGKSTRLIKQMDDAPAKQITNTNMVCRAGRCSQQSWHIWKIYF